jgi:hypothetical protein
MLLLVFRLLRKLNTEPKTFEIKTAVYLGLLFLLASMSSFLALIPLGLAVLLLAYKAFRDPSYRPLAIVSAVVTAIRASSAFTAFSTGMGGPSIPDTLAELMIEMGYQLQPGSTLGGLVFVLLGFAAIIVLDRTLPMLFLAGSMILVPLGIVTIWKFSIVNGGYYINLVSGFAALIGAFGVGQIFGLDPTFQDVLQRTQAAPTSIKGNLRTILPFVLGAVLLVLLTVKLPAPNVFGDQANGSTFERLIANDAHPVVTNMPSMAETVNYYRTIRADKDLRRNELLHEALDHRFDTREVFDGVRIWIECPSGTDLNECIPKNRDYYLALKAPGQPILGEPTNASTTVPPSCELALPDSDKARFYKCSASAPTQ